MLNARIVREHDTTASGVAELADDGRMSAADDANNAALGTTSSGHAAEASDFGNDGVAMHGVFDLIARNENVAVNVG